MEELLKKQQKIRFSGSGASHQNGAVERSINTVVTMKMTMLMQAEITCPLETLSTDLWTMKIDYAKCLYSLIPDMQSGLSAI